MGIFDLSGRIAVVTGGNGGIGLGIARGLAEAGADIAIWARNQEKSEHAKGQIEAFGRRAIALRCDVSSEEDTAEALARTLEAFGRVDIGVANAGFGAPGDPLQTSLERWRKVTSVDLDGCFLTLRDIALMTGKGTFNQRSTWSSAVAVESSWPSRRSPRAREPRTRLITRLPRRGSAPWSGPWP